MAPHIPVEVWLLICEAVAKHCTDVWEDRESLGDAREKFCDSCRKTLKATRRVSRTAYESSSSVLFRHCSMSFDPTQPLREQSAKTILFRDETWRYVRHLNVTVDAQSFSVDDQIYRNCNNLQALRLRVEGEDKQVWELAAMMQLRLPSLKTIGIHLPNGMISESTTAAQSFLRIFEAQNWLRILSVRTFSEWRLFIRFEVDNRKAASSSNPAGIAQSGVRKEEVVRHLTCVKQPRGLASVRLATLQQMLQQPLRPEAFALRLDMLRSLIFKGCSLESRGLETLLKSPLSSLTYLSFEWVKLLRSTWRGLPWLQWWGNMFYRISSHPDLLKRCKVFFRGVGYQHVTVYEWHGPVMTLNENDRKAWDALIAKHPRAIEFNDEAPYAWPGMLIAKLSREQLRKIIRPRPKQDCIRNKYTDSHPWVEQGRQNCTAEVDQLVYHKGNQRWCYEHALEARMWGYEHEDPGNPPYPFTLPETIVLTPEMVDEYNPLL